MASFSAPRRALLLAAVGATILLGASACSASPQGGDDSDGEGGRLTIAMNAGLIPVFEDYVKRFQDEHEGWDIEVTTVPSSTADYIQQLTTQALAKDGADLLFNADAINQTLAGNNVLLDLAPVMDGADAGSLARENFLPNFLGQYKVGDAVTGIPVSADSGVLYYNADLFAQYGVEVPTAEWTYEDMYAAARKIHDASGGEVYGLQTPLGAGDAFFTSYPVIRASGSDIYDADAEKFVFADQAGIEAWETLYAPYLEGFGSPYSADNTTQWFATGQAAMVIDTTGAVSFYRESLKDAEWDVVPSPRLDGESTTGGGSYALSVSASAPNQDDALVFLEWFYSVDGGMAAAAPNGVIPATEEGIAGGDWKTEAASVPSNFVTSAEYAATNAVLPTAVPDEVASDVSTALRTALERVLLEDMSVADAYTAAQDQLNDLLNG